MGIRKAGHEEHCPAIADVQRPGVPLFFDPKEVMEVSLLPARGKTCVKVHSLVQDVSFHA